jgi:hypothetical protein
MEIVIYKDLLDRQPLLGWLKSLKDAQARQRVWTRIAPAFSSETSATVSPCMAEFWSYGSITALVTGCT